MITSTTTLSTSIPSHAPAFLLNLLALLALLALLPFVTTDTGTTILQNFRLCAAWRTLVVSVWCL
jgi:hypothetical protein